MSDDDFTLAGYSRLLGELQERGYEARGFHDAEVDRRHVILRHDVDMSLDAAVRMGEVERELGVASIYFVLVRTELYNLFSAANERHLRQLLSDGHEIGLHFDAALYPESLEEIETACATECSLLEEFLGERVRTISFHRPAKRLVGLDRPLAGRRHAYEPRFVSEIGYCSDSRGAWRHGHPLDHPALAEGRALQLLTHPIWWDAHPGESPAQKLDRLAMRRFDTYRSELAYHCEPYRRALKANFPILDSPTSDELRRSESEGKTQ